MKVLSSRALSLATVLPTMGLSGVLGSAPAQAQEPAPLQVSLNKSTITESDGMRALLVTITRSGDLSAPLRVRLSSHLTTGEGDSPLRLPERIDIPAGAAARSFFVGVREDDVYDGSQSVTIVATTEAGAVEQQVTVTDTTPTVTLAIAPPTISEGHPRQEAIGTVTRSNVGRYPLRLRLTASDERQVKVPVTVTIPPGKRTATFRIRAIDDKVVDGTQLVTIGVRTGLRGGEPVQATVTVEDNDAPRTVRVRLIVQPGEFREGRSGRGAVGIIKLDCVTNTPVTFTVTSSDESEARVPQQVTIPAGRSLAAFPIEVIDDTIDDGSQTVTISVTSASGTVSQTITVRDNDGNNDGNDDDGDDDDGDDDNGDDGDDDDDRPVSPVAISSATASVSDDGITINLSGALNGDVAENTSHYVVRINGRVVALEEASYDAATNSIELSLPEDVLRAGDMVAVTISGLRDTQGATLRPRTIVVRAS